MSRNGTLILAILILATSFFPLATDISEPYENLLQIASAQQQDYITVSGPANPIAGQEAGPYSGTFHYSSKPDCIFVDWGDETISVVSQNKGVNFNFDPVTGDGNWGSLSHIYGETGVFYIQASFGFLGTGNSPGGVIACHAASFSILPGFMKVTVVSTRGNTLCPLSEHFTIAVANSSSQLTAIAAPGYSQTEKIIVNASKLNFGKLEVILDAQRNASTISSMIPLDAIQTSFGNNDFFISPGESINVPLKFQVASTVPIGSFVYTLDASAKDEYGCPVSTASATVGLAIKTPPDFSISVSPGNLTLSREQVEPTFAKVRISALANTAGPLQLRFVSSGWNQSSTTPVYTTDQLDNSTFVLNPGTNETRSLLLSAKETPSSSIQGSSIKDYTGVFLYTVVAQGVWSEDGQNIVITKMVDLPINVTEVPFEFALTANQTNLSLSNQSGASTFAKLSVSSISGRNLPVSLDQISWNPDLDVKFDNVHGTPDFSTDIRIKLLTSELKSKEILISASGGGLTHTLTLHLNGEGYTIQIDSQPRFNSSITIDGDTISAESLSLPLKMYTPAHNVNAAQFVYKGNDTRYVFSGWSDGSNQNNRIVTAASDTILIAKYKPQYLLTVNSAFGTISGSGWYDANSTATFKVNSLLVADSSGINYQFNSWIGESNQTLNKPCDSSSSQLSNSSNWTVCMNRPIILNANWEQVKPNANAVPLIGYTLGGISIAAVISSLHFVVPKPLPKPHFHPGKVTVHIDVEFKSGHSLDLTRSADYDWKAD